ncbi:MAG: AhpC/TSA family protein, partial [Deltaproteobacteria bacterium]
MSLQEQLNAHKQERFAQIPDEVKTTMLNDLKQLSESGIVENAPKVGDLCPDVTLPNQRGEQVRLSSLLQNGPLVVTFYRGGWCPYCNLELRAYQQALPQIQAAGGSLVAITPELPDASLSTAEKNEL